MPAVAETLKRVANKVYLWPHDTCAEKLTEAQIQGFDGVFWLSEWQRQQWILVNPSFAKFTQIFWNGILPEQFKPVQKRENPYACIYGSNYARGLEILLDLWPRIKGEFPRATLDIYYGWKHWGCLSAAKEASMRAQVVDLAALDVHEHGLVGHETLNRAYERASFWTYPCTLPETFCITALRAQLAGAIPVILEGSALSETVRYGYRCSKKEDYYKTLVSAFQQAEKISLEERQNMGKFILEKFTWDALARRWQEVFEGPVYSEPKAESPLLLIGICVLVGVGVCIVVLRRRKLSRV
jgi:glycosyltransferase involved in cell wall biosynthesis